MMRPRDSIGLTILAALLACSPAGIVDQGIDENLQFDEARARWQASRPAVYQVVIERGCFCLVDETVPIRVTVRGSTILSAVHVRTGKPASTALPQVMTIDELFDVIGDTIEQQPDHLVVKYDRALGYPRSIRVDHIASAADDELSVTASAFLGFN